MVKLHGDKTTMDLFSRKPETPKVARFAEEVVRAATFAAKVSKAVSQILQDAKDQEEDPLNRDEIALGMSEYLGEEITVNMLNAYASLARETHSIPMVRALALMHVTKDYRLLQLIAEEMGLAVIPRQYESTVREAILAESIEEQMAELKALRRGRKS